MIRSPGAGTGMEETTMANSLRLLEGRSEQPTIAELHKYILSLIAMLSALLSLKQQRAGMASLLDIDDPNFVSISVALTFYGGVSIGAACILEAHPNSNWGKLMSNLSLFFGALTYILELMILVPALGVAALLFWIICFVSFMTVYSYPYLKSQNIVYKCSWSL
ncbi:unnamed protein product [Prunus brigantina]